jgi:hypothetical protein
MTEDKKKYSPDEGIGGGGEKKFVTEEDVYAIVQTLLLDSAQVIRVKSGYIQSRNYASNVAGWKADANGVIEATVIGLVSLAANPAGPSEVGDMCCVAGKLKVCTTAGTPGTWTIVEIGRASCRERVCYSV